MANIGSAKKVSRIILTDATGSHKRMAQAYIGTNYCRHLFYNGTGTLNGVATNEGGQTWSASTDLSMDASGLRNTSTTTGRGALVNCGQKDGFFSMVFRLSVTPSSDNNMTFYFRALNGMALPNGDENADSYCLKFIPQLGGVSCDFYEGTTLIGNRTLSTNHSNGTFSAEVYASGSNIELWINGFLEFSRTSALFNDSSHTTIGVGFAPNTNSTDARIREVFVTDVPSCPGAIDVDTFNNRINYTSIAPGTNIPVKIRTCSYQEPTVTLPRFDTIGIRFVDDNGTQIGNGSYEDFTQAASSNRSAYMSSPNWHTTHNGASTGAGGSARHGLYHLLLKAVSTDATNPFHVISDGNVVDAGPGQFDWGRGYMVAPTTVTAVTVPASKRVYPDAFNLSFTTAHQPLRPGATPTIQTIQSTTTRESRATTWSTATCSSSTNFLVSTLYRGTTGTTIGGVFGVGVKQTAVLADATNFNSSPIFLYTSVPAGYVLSTLESATSASGTFQSSAEDRFDLDWNVDMIMVSNQDPPNNNFNQVYNRGEAATVTLTIKNANNAGFTPRGTQTFANVTGAAGGSTEGANFTINSSSNGLFEITRIFGSTEAATTDGTGTNKFVRWRDSAANAPTPADGGNANQKYAALDSVYVAQRHLQVDENASIVTANTETLFERLVSEFGFYTFRILNRRSQPVAGVGPTGSAKIALQDDKSLVTRRETTGTLGATDSNGYFALQEWDNALPGGAWDVWISNGTTGNGTVEKSGNTASFNRKTSGSFDFTLLASNPNYRVIVGGGVATGGQEGDHWHAGDTLQVGAALADFGNMDLLTPISSGAKAPKCIIARFTDAGTAETFRADAYTGIAVTAGTWVTLPDDSDISTAGTLINLFNAETALGASADSRVWIVQIHSSLTASWSYTDLIVVARLYHSSGTPYSNSNSVPNLSPSSNRHHTYAADPLGLLGLPGFK